MSAKYLTSESEELDDWETWGSEETEITLSRSSNMMIEGEWSSASEMLSSIACLVSLALPRESLEQSLYILLFEKQMI